VEKAQPKFRREIAMRIKKQCIFFVIILLSTFFAETAFAAKGEVVYKKSGCDYFIVETYMGYALLEWFGGNDPDEGDVIVGKFESYGFKDIYNLTADSELRVWVEDYWLSREDALEQYFEHCD
jgi:hypothetical protein